MTLKKGQSRETGTQDEDFILFYFIYCVQRHFQQYFSYIMATSFSGGRSRSPRREPLTHGQATGKLYHLRLRVDL